MLRALGWVGATIISVVLIAALFVVIFFAHWWLFAYSVGKSAQIYQSGYGAQTAFIAQAQNLAIVNTISGPAVWDAATHNVRLTGPSTVTVKPKA